MIGNHDEIRRLPLSPRVEDAADQELIEELISRGRLVAAQARNEVPAGMVREPEYQARMEAEQGARIGGFIARNGLNSTDVEVGRENAVFTMVAFILKPVKEGSH